MLSTRLKHSLIHHSSSLRTTQSVLSLSKLSFSVSTLSAIPTYHHQQQQRISQTSSTYFSSSPHQQHYSMSSSLLPAPSKTSRDTYCDEIPTTFSMNTIRCFGDNNCYVLRDPAGFITIVDPAEPESVISGLLELGIDLKNDKEQLEKTMLLITHHHWDHSGGNQYFSTVIKAPTIIGGAFDNIPHATQTVQHDEEFSHGDFTFQALHTPCHTKGHICYLFHNNTIVSHDSNLKKKWNATEYGIFTGDTLFSSGSGKFFEGTADHMYQNMELFNTLPSNTFIYDGHEYTKSNLTFASKLDPNNAQIHKQLDWIQQHPGVPTHPTTIGLEKKINIFLRSKNAHVLGNVRGMKDKGMATPLPEDSWLNTL